MTRSSIRRWALAIFAVPAIVLGLLGMHFLAQVDAGAMPAMSADSMSADSMSADSMSAGEMHQHSAAQTIPVGETPTHNNDSPEHQLMSMACILALLVTLLVAASPSARAWGVQRAAELGRVIAVGTLAAPRPPSLTVLSIRRT